MSDWLEALFRLVDKFYTPKELKVSVEVASKKIDWLIWNNQSGVLVDKGLMTANEHWQIMTYLWQVRDDMAQNGRYNRSAYAEYCSKDVQLTA